MQSNDSELEYVGFWARVCASVIDSILIMLVITPVLAAIYGAENTENKGLVTDPLYILINFILPAVAVILFWIAKQATPGKMAISARIVDAETGKEPSKRQLIIRYLGYYVSLLPLFLGIIWVAFDSRKQGWHDKLAGTVVVRPKLRGSHPVDFKT